MPRPCYSRHQDTLYPTQRSARIRSGTQFSACFALRGARGGATTCQSYFMGEFMRRATSHLVLVLLAVVLVVDAQKLCIEGARLLPCGTLSCAASSGNLVLQQEILCSPSLEQQVLFTHILCCASIFRRSFLCLYGIISVCRTGRHNWSS